MNTKGSVLVTLGVIVVSIAVLAGLYFLLASPSLQIFILVLAVVLLLFGLVLVIWELSYGPGKLKRRLRKLEHLVDHEAVGSLEQLYRECHGLYGKLSDQHKSLYYTKLHKLRSQMEHHLSAEKRVQAILRQLGEKSKAVLKTKKKTLEELYALFQNLPSKVQQNYYQHVIELRQKLEGKRKL